VIGLDLRRSAWFDDNVRQLICFRWPEAEAGLPSPVRSANCCSTARVQRRRHEEGRVNFLSLD
jgi:hypothetical protein